MNKKYKIILLALLFFASAGILFAVKEYNRKPAGVENSPAAFAISATEFIMEYSGQQDVSNRKYLGKIILVHGKVNAIDSANQKIVTIVLGEAGSSSGIRCNMDDTSLNSSQTIREQDSISIKGICTGYIPDEMGLGADIILNKSIIIVNN